MGKIVSKLFGGGDSDSNESNKKIAEAQQQQATAQEAANVAAKEATATAERARQTQLNMQTNMAADLKQENVGQVLAGGTADASGLDTDLLKKRKAASGGLSSTLGINA